MYKNIYYQREKNLIHLWDSQRGYTTFPYTRYAYELAENGEARSIFGDRLTKIYKFQKDDPSLFESDVPETTRVLVDLYSESDIASDSIKTFTLDIEVEMITGLPDIKEANNAITSIAYYDTESKEYVVLILDNDDKIIKKQTEKALVVPFSTEADLLEYFLGAYEIINPDIITGWNIDFFDMPYLYNRIVNVLGTTHAKRISPIGEVFWSPYRQRYFFAGVSCLDYINLYRNYNFGELPNYRLDTVGRLEIGMGKIEYEGNLDDLFKTDVDKFVEYNLVDVEIVVKLDEKLQFIDLCRGICHSGHVPYEDFVYSSKYLEGALLTYLRRRGLVAPNKPADRREKMAALKEAGAEKFIGAYVKDPIVGKYDWVYDLDLTSLYPMIIITLNISTETKFAKILIEDWDSSDFLNGKYINTDIKLHIAQNDEIVDIPYNDFKEFIDKGNHSISSNGVIYKVQTEEKLGWVVSKTDTSIIINLSDKEYEFKNKQELAEFLNRHHVKLNDKDEIIQMIGQGCIPGILSAWFDKRVEYKDLMKKYGHAGDDEKYKFYAKRQLVQKILLNSLYGVLGLPAFRFYDLDNAEAVTTTGQTVIKSTANMANAKYNSELYSNERIEVIDENGKSRELKLTESVDVIRNGIELNIQAQELVENDELISI